jgi:hypothetical protein
MKEQLITFETAKLAKEKGFNIPTKKAYKEYKGVQFKTVNEFKVKKYNHNNLNGNCLNISAPTQSLLQKWLREVHRVNNSYIIPDGHGNYVPWKGLLTMDNLYLFHRELKFKTYEEALEEGLIEALKLIKI